VHLGERTGRVHYLPIGGRSEGKPQGVAQTFRDRKDFQPLFSVGDIAFALRSCTTSFVIEEHACLALDIMTGNCYQRSAASARQHPLQSDQSLAARTNRPTCRSNDWCLE
jgi:hypothetical protein